MSWVRFPKEPRVKDPKPRQRTMRFSERVTVLACVAQIKWTQRVSGRDPEEGRAR